MTWNFLLIIRSVLLKSIDAFDILKIVDKINPRKEGFPNYKRQYYKGVGELLMKKKTLSKPMCCILH